MPLIARIAIVFASGAIAGAFLPLNIFGPVAIIAAISLLRIRNESFILVAIACIGMGLGARRAAEPSCIPKTQSIVVFDGIVESRADDEHPTIVVHPRGCRERVRVRLPDDASPPLGVTLHVKGMMPEGVVFATSAVVNTNFKRDYLLSLRGSAQDRIRKLFPTAYPLAEALLISQREALSSEVKAAFAASGLTHLLAISGSHVALVAAMIMTLASLLRCSRRATSAMSMLGACGYVFFLGAPFAALRSLIQMAMLMLSRARQQPAHPLGLLAAAAIAITAIDPAAPIDAGFQLSFAGILGIILWRRPLIDLMPSSIPTPVRDAIATTLAASATTTPIAAFHFGVVSVIALVANMLAAPAVALAVPAAAVVLLISPLSMHLAQLLAPGAELTLLWLMHIAQWCASIPGGHFSVTAANAMIATACVALVFVLLKGSYRSTLQGRVAIAGMSGLTLLLVVPVGLSPRREIQVHMIDVGQGDAFAIRSPRGRWLLVDAGPSSRTFDAGKSRVVPFLLAHQAARIEAVILSHPHLDHFGGMLATMSQLHVRALIDPGLPVASRDFDHVLAAAQAHGLPWLVARPGSVLRLDGMTLEFLTPDSVLLDASLDANDYSAAFRLSYGHFSALFLGDLPERVEDEMVRRYGSAMDVDVLKVGHHGSGGSSGRELLAAATPQVALISVGRGNRYGHPDADAMARLEGIGARIFRTDQDGSVSVYAEEDGRIRVRTSQ